MAFSSEFKVAAPNQPKTGRFLGPKKRHAVINEVLAPEQNIRKEILTCEINNKGPHMADYRCSWTASGVFFSQMDLSIKDVVASVCAAGDSASYHRSSVYGDDVIIVVAYQTPLYNSKRGGFKDTYPDDLLALVLKEAAPNQPKTGRFLGLKKRPAVIKKVLAPEQYIRKELIDLYGQTNNSCELASEYQSPVVTSFRDWVGLDLDLLDLVIQKLCPFLDYLRFCGVCTQWRSIALLRSTSHMQSLDLLKASSNKLPLLMIKIEEDNDDRLGLYSVSEGITYNFQLLSPHRNRFIGSSHGWLFCVEEREVITLLNQLNNNRITLPISKDSDNVNWDHAIAPDYYLIKGILTADPYVSHNDYSVVIIYSGLCKLLVYRSGDQHWKFINSDHGRCAFYDVVCYKSKIYGVTFHSKLVQVDFDTGTGKTIIIESSDSQVYLVESRGELLLVQRFWELDETEDSETERNTDTDIGIQRSITDDFKISKFVDEKESAKWIEIDHIGEQALFVGDN